MVAEDGDGWIGANKPGSAISKSFDDREHLLVVNLVVNLRGREFPRKESDRMPFPLLVQLLNYSSKGRVGSVRVDPSFKCRVEMPQDRSGGEGFLEQGESAASRVGKSEARWRSGRSGRGFMGEIMERGSEVGEIGNEPAIEIGEAKK